MITTDFLSGRISGTRLRVEVVAPVYTWQQKRPAAIAGPVVLAARFAGDSHMTDNSTDVSARKRRRL